MCCVIMLLPREQTVINSVSYSLKNLNEINEKESRVAALNAIQ